MVGVLVCHYVRVYCGGCFSVSLCGVHCDGCFGVLFRGCHVVGVLVCLLGGSVSW